jgi:hypothetical protein
MFNGGSSHSVNGSSTYGTDGSRDTEPFIYKYMIAIPMGVNN